MAEEGDLPHHRPPRSTSGRDRDEIERPEQCVVGALAAAHAEMAVAATKAVVQLLRQTGHSPGYGFRIAARRRNPPQQHRDEALHR